MFKETSVETEGKYGLTNLSQLLRNDIKGKISLKNDFEMLSDPVCLKAWAVLEKCVRSEKHLVPYNEVSGDSSASHEHEHGQEHSQEHSHKHGHGQEHSHEGHEWDASTIETLTLMKYYSHGFKELEAKKAQIVDLGMYVSNVMHSYSNYK